MPSPGTLVTYDMVGIKEDISNIIKNISPTDVPFQSSIGSESIHQLKHQWQEDSLAAAIGTNAVVQGSDAGSAVFVATVMRDNITQILEKVVAVADTMQVVSTYGRDKELAYQMAKKSKEIKRDFETTLLSHQTRVTGDGVSTAGKMDGAYVQVDSTHKFHAADATTTLNPAAPAAFNETVLLKANQVLYTDGGEAEILMIKPADSLILASLAAATGRLRELGADSKKIVNVVNVYVSPFGEQKVVLNRFMPTTDAYMFCPANWKKLVLRNWFRETLAKTGDSTKVMMRGEFSLKHTNFKSSAIITDLT